MNIARPLLLLLCLRSSCFAQVESPPSPTSAPGRPQLTLPQLAEAALGKLSPPEIEFFEGIALKRERISFVTPTPTGADPPPGGPEVRAACITWLCTDPQAMTFVGYEGIDLEGATLTGNLSLRSRTIPFAVSFRLCVIGDIDLSGATLTTFQIEYGRIGNVNGNKISADRLEIRNQTHVHGRIMLKQARIARTFDISGSTLKGDGHHIALEAPGMRLDGTMPADGVICEGKVDLTSARVAGDLSFRDCQFLYNGPGFAFTADRAVVEGGLLMGGLSKSVGAVSLVDATVRVFEDSPQGWPPPGRIYVQGLTYTSLGEAAPKQFALRDEWLNRLGGRYSPQPYDQLASVLRNSGYRDDARRVLFEKEWDAIWGEPFRWRSILEIPAKLILWATIGFGYRRWLALVWFAVLVLVRSLAIGYGLRRGTVHYRGSDVQPPRSIIMLAIEELVPGLSFGLACVFTLGSRAQWHMSWMMKVVGLILASVLVAAWTGILATN